MHRLPIEKRKLILHLLVEGSSLRSISRITGASTTTIMKLLREVGSACAEYHDQFVRDVHAQLIQCDEIWSFCYAKEKNVETAKSPPEGAGNIWTWTAIEDKSKLVISWMISPDRGTQYAHEFMNDLQSRLSDRVQLTTDGLTAYLTAVEDAFGSDVDYAQLVKEYRGASRFISAKKVPISGNPDPRLINTSYVERHNLTMRMSMRRFTRLTNGFSKTIRNHHHALALYFVWYNFCRPHQSLGTFVTPAIAAKLTNEQYDLEWLLLLADRNSLTPN